MHAHQRQPEMPTLQVLPVAHLLLHEQHDTQRSEPLQLRLQQEGVLKNPSIVAPIAGNGGASDELRYVVLDGANRVTVMRALGIAHIAAQVVDYEDPELVLDTWHHLIKGMQGQRLLDLLRALDCASLRQTDLMQARALLARRDIVAFVQTVEREVWVVECRGDLHACNHCLNEVVNAYKSEARIFRANTDHLDELLPLYEAVTALIVFPRFAPAEVMELARVGACLPAGITRHLIPRRALRINLPLDVLRSPASLAEKNLWLADWMKQKVAAKTARFYQESTFLFDE